MVESPASIPPKGSWLGIVAASLLAYALCDVLHEAAHAVATLLPLGVRALSISTVAVVTTRSNPVVAAAGSLANLIFGLTLALSFRYAVRSPWRYFWWLFGSINLFNATGYLLYSAVLDSGDMAVVFRTLVPSPFWRPAVGLVGLAAYTGAVYVSLLGFGRLVATGVIAASRAEPYCMLPYWSGGLLLTAGAALNPQSPWLVLTSGAAVGFGAMVGLVLVPRLLRRLPRARAGANERRDRFRMAVGAFGHGRGDRLHRLVRAGHSSRRRLAPGVRSSGFGTAGRYACGNRPRASHEPKFDPGGLR